jgi:hypothetical protein
MSLKQTFADNQSLSYSDIMNYLLESTEYKFVLREVTVNGHWAIEACAIATISGINMLIIFNEDALSPYRNYNQIEAERLLNNINDHYNNVMKMLKI